MIQELWVELAVGSPGGPVIVLFGGFLLKLSLSEGRNWVVPRELSSRPEWMTGFFYLEKEDICE